MTIWQFGLLPSDNGFVITYEGQSLPYRIVWAGAFGNPGRWAYIKPDEAKPSLRFWGQHPNGFESPEQAADAAVDEYMVEMAAHAIVEIAPQ